MADDACTCEVILEFAGGLETITANQASRVRLKILAGCVTLSQLVAYVRRTVLGSKRELFAYPPELVNTPCRDIVVQGDFPGLMNASEHSKVRPGVLVLVEDIDWELLGIGTCELRGVTNVSFISSLHGG